MADQIDQLEAMRERHRLALRAEERELARAALTVSQGRWEVAAARLGVSVSTLQRLLERHPDLAQMRRDLRNRVTEVTPTRKELRAGVKTGTRTKPKTAVSR